MSTRMKVAPLDASAARENTADMPSPSSGGMPSRRKERSTPKASHAITSSSTSGTAESRKKNDQLPAYSAIWLSRTKEKAFFTAAMIFFMPEVCAKRAEIKRARPAVCGAAF